MSPNVFLGILLAGVLMFADHACAAEPEILPAVRDQFAAVAAHPQVKHALAFIKGDDAKTLAEQKTIGSIASPPFNEKTRAQDYVKRLAALGVSNAAIDKEGNVIAVRPGTGGGPKLVVSAHLDTVFPAGTDLTIK